MKSCKELPLQQSQQSLERILARYIQKTIQEQEGTVLRR